MSPEDSSEQPKTDVNEHHQHSDSQNTKPGYEDDKISNDDTSSRRYPERNRNPTGSDIKIMEHLAQTPTKGRKAYRRTYKNADLEAIANVIFQKSYNFHF